MFGHSGAFRECTFKSSCVAIYKRQSCTSPGRDQHENEWQLYTIVYRYSADYFGWWEFKKLEVIDMVNKIHCPFKYWTFLLTDKNCDDNGDMELQLCNHEKIFL